MLARELPPKRNLLQMVVLPIPAHGEHESEGFLPYASYDACAEIYDACVLLCQKLLYGKCRLLSTDGSESFRRHKSIDAGRGTRRDLPHPGGSVQC